jgi:Leucine-rich repeat (LRR) protein
MSWGSSACINVYIGEESFKTWYEGNTERQQLYREILAYLRDYHVKIPQKIQSPDFFDALNYYLSFDPQPLSYDISDIYPGLEYLEIQNPVEAFEFIVSMAYLSCKLPSEVITIEMGDASYFVLNYKLLNGKLIEIRRDHWDHDLDKLVPIEDDSPSLEDFFHCTEAEMRAFFKVPITKRLKRNVKDDYLSVFDLHCQSIIISNKNIRLLLPEITRFKNLKILNLDGNQISTLPKELFELEQLEELDLSSNKLNVLPPDIGKLKNLKKLSIRNMKLTHLPDELTDLSNLTKLDVGGNELISLPETIGKLKKLEIFGASDNQIKRLPESFCELKNLREFVMIRTELEKLPENIGQLSNLEVLRIEHNRIVSLPDSFGKLRKVKQLNLRSTSEFVFKEFPRILLELSDLEKLSFGFFCTYTELPAEIDRMKSLRILDLSNSRHLKELPSSIGKLTQLEELNLEHTDLHELPENIGELKKLKEINFQQTHILKLPVSLLALNWLTMHTDKGILTMEGPETIAYFEKIIESKEELLKIFADKGNVFKFCSEELRSDRTFALWFDGYTSPSTSYDGHAFNYLGDKLKNDKAFALEMISKHGSNLQYFSEQIRSEVELVKIALASYYDNFQFVPEHLKQDIAFVDELFMHNPLIYNMLPESLRRRPEYIYPALKASNLCVLSVPKEFHQDKDIMIYALSDWICNDDYSFLSDTLKRDRWFVVRAIIQFDLSKLYGEIKKLHLEDELICKLLTLPIEEKIQTVKSYFETHNPSISIDEVLVIEDGKM